LKYGGKNGQVYCNGEILFSTPICFALLGWKSEKLGWKNLRMQEVNKGLKVVIRNIFIFQMPTFLKNQLIYMGWIFFKNRLVTKESSCFTLVYNFCWKRKMLCIKVFLKSTILLLNFVFEMCMSIHCISYSCCHCCLLQSCFLIDIQFFGSLICNFGNCANVNSKLKITLKDLIKKGVPFARNETQ